MRIRQYVYFTLVSEQMPAAEMAQRLGMPADEVSVRAAKVAVPPRPVAHAWKVVCRDAGLTVDELIADVVRRLTPVAEAIGQLARVLQQSEGERAGARLQVIRYFNDDLGDEEEITVVDGLEKLPGQHQLLGWHVGREVLEFLGQTGADLDVDEYN